MRVGGRFVLSPVTHLAEACVKGQVHEGFTGHAEEKTASEKSLGRVFAVVCGLIAAFGFYKGSSHAPYWTLAAIVFLLLAYFWNAPLKPLNRFWMKLGQILFLITNPLIMGIIFFGVVTPTGLIMRALGKDLLKMKLDRNAKSYWIERNPPGPAGPEMTNQF